MFDDTNDFDDDTDVLEIAAPSKKKCCEGMNAACKGCGKCKMMKQIARNYGELPWAG